jgi:moderate conductance mechanosensitive channel
MIPFKSIDVITNYSKDYSYALVEVGVSYSSDIEFVKKVLIQTAKELRLDPVVGALILDDLEINGVIALSDSSVNVRCKLKTAPGQQFSVKYKFLEKIHDNFIANGVVIPYPHSVVIMKKDDH